MAETLYAIMKSGQILPITNVTAFDIDNTLTIRPGDFYRNEWVEQQNDGLDADHPLLITEQKGDQTGSPAALRTESWLCSFWKFTRSVAPTVIYIPWSLMEGIGDGYPNRVLAGATYFPLKSGNIAVISGVSTITENTTKAVYPGDYYRNEYIEQANDGSAAAAPLLVTNQFGDARDGDALNPELWDASHLEIDRSGSLITLFIPWINTVGPCTSFPNRPVA